MSEHPKLPPRLRWIFPRHPVFFVTFCTYRRRKLLASHRIHTPFVTFAIRAYSEYGIAVGRYVIMPDHLHLFVCGPDDFELGRWIGMLKQALARQTGQSKATVWQRGFFDHLLRTDESYAQKWNYVRENPVRAGLVKQADDWPYSGEIVVINRA
jgi:putative transposase